MHKYAHLMVKNMDCKQAYDARWVSKPRLYNIVSIAFFPSIFDEPLKSFKTLLLVQSIQPACVPGDDGQDGVAREQAQWQICRLIADGKVL